MPNRRGRDSDEMSDRQIVADTRERVTLSASSFDKFTVKLTGSVFNGREEVIDESGGILGRQDKRIEEIERKLEATAHVLTARLDAHDRWFKAIKGTLIAMAALIFLNGGITNAKTIGELVEKIIKLY